MDEAVRTRHLAGYPPGVLELPRKKKLVRRATGNVVAVSDILQIYKNELLRVIEIDADRELIRLRNLLKKDEPDRWWPGAPVGCEFREPDDPRGGLDPFF
jgi:hypothetical protein